MGSYMGGLKLGVIHRSMVTPLSCFLWALKRVKTSIYKSHKLVGILWAHTGPINRVYTCSDNHACIETVIIIATYV